MEKYEEMRDSLICEKNDEIDNAAHDIICAVVTEKSKEERLDAVKELIARLTVENGEIKDPEGIMGDLEALILSFSISYTDDEIDWNMSWIAEVTEKVEGWLDDQGIAVCHPFFDEDEDGDSEHYDEDNDGILCCLSESRCENCPMKIE